MCEKINELKKIVKLAKFNVHFGQLRRHFCAKIKMKLGSKFNFTLESIPGGI
jgi:hypothetical protein